MYRMFKLIFISLALTSFGVSAFSEPILDHCTSKDLREGSIFNSNAGLYCYKTSHYSQGVDYYKIGFERVMHDYGWVIHSNKNSLTNAYSYKTGLTSPSSTSIAQQATVQDFVQNDAEKQFLLMLPQMKSQLLTLKKQPSKSDGDYSRQRLTVSFDGESATLVYAKYTRFDGSEYEVALSLYRSADYSPKSIEDYFFLFQAQTN